MARQSGSTASGGGGIHRDASRLDDALAARAHADPDAFSHAHARSFRIAGRHPVRIAIAYTGAVCDPHAHSNLLSDRFSGYAATQRNPAESGSFAEPIRLASQIPRLDL